ncbi:class E sortase [Streptomyces sp. TRM 70351]|uniref:class E sortase n=1 Tax=Streptomyces sp. TRM 70351 TaxID=3116552 RepID=UPI002E7AFFC5|nr:class E sortase [Streptomyces sp. TRM 70351]MEE1930037.1 class E sortase [Streptomyces sp. TRM 70351]
MTSPGDPYTDPEALEEAVGRLEDPLNDPLPGRDAPRAPHVPGAVPPPARGERPTGGEETVGGEGARGAHAGSPWFRTRPVPPEPVPPRSAPPRPAPPRPSAPVPPETAGAPPAPGSRHGATWPGAGEAADDPQTVALRRVRPRPAAPAPQPRDPRPEDRQPADRPSAAPGGGRAARRRAAAQAARAHKDSFSVVASRAVGELFITCGVLLLLFVTYQLWWTNVQADMAARGTASDLTQRWETEDADARRPGAFTPGEGFAIMYIPKLDVRVPVAEGIDKNSVLDRGLAGHYDEESGLKTAMPWDEEGNFAVAGHRNTHGEPFRYINKLEPGDPIVVETRDTYYTYEMTSMLPSTLPSNVDVVSPVPEESGFTEPGRYVTLTTCTPEFTSKYRLIVWGKMVEERPRSEGKPDALVG